MAFDPGNPNRDRRVVCAANRNLDSGLVICGARHFDNVMRRAIEATGIPCQNQHWDQGFIDNRGEWLTRAEAMKLAVDAGQLPEKYKAITELFSEDLY